MPQNPGILFSLFSLIYCTFISIMYFSKRKVKTTETNIYSLIVLITLVGNIISIGTYYFMLHLDKFKILNSIFSRLYLIFMIVYAFAITYYVIAITFNKKVLSRYEEKYLKYSQNIIVFFTILCSIIACVLPIKFNNINAVYSEGLAVDFIYFITRSCILLWIVLLILRIRKIRDNKYFPMIIYVILGGIVSYIQGTNPEYLLTTSMVVFVTFMMYFTIENPDVKMLSEVYKNKSLVEQTYIDKSNFLFEMTNEVREPISVIEKLTSKIKNNQNKEDIKEYINHIDTLSKQLDYTVNNVLNVSTLDINKIKIIDNRYNITLLFDDIVNRIQNNIQDNIEFRISKPSNLPIVYGDQMKIKQVLYSILMNSVKKTENGFIDFKLDIIERYDICRLIFTIADSGKGIPIEKINDILSATGEIKESDIELLEKNEINVELCQKVIKVLGGNLIIKSELGKGTKTILTIDQRKFIDETNKLNDYENIVNTKQVLVVSQDNKIIETIKKQFKEKNILGSYLLYGLDAVDKIKSNKKYDYIIISDEMDVLSGYETLKEIKKYNKKIPLIVLLTEKKENIKEHFIKDGFKDYIMINNLEQDLERIIEKY